MSAIEVLRHSAIAFDHNPRDLVTLVVGREQKEMIVHGTYLIRDSGFFEAALKREWTEGQLRRVELPENAPNTIGHYLTYVYTGKLPTSDVESMPPCETTNLLEEPYFRIVFNLLVRLYVCGEQLLNQPIRRAVIKELIRLTELEDENGNTWGVDNREISIIYKGTPEGSPARRLLVDMHIRGDPRQWLSKEADPGFVLDAARAYNRIVKTKSLEELDSRLKFEDYL